MMDAGSGGRTPQRKKATGYEVIDLENINYAMRSETQFVLRCEEVFHDKISAAATTILSNKGEKPLVAPDGVPPAAVRLLPPCVCRVFAESGVHVSAEHG